MESPETKVIWVAKIPPKDFKVDKSFLDLYFSGGHMCFFMETIDLDPEKPLRLMICQP